jgi:GMP synthase-like glutamine amidotransferase
MKILIIQNDSLGQPGIVAERIEARGGKAEIREPHEGDPLPETPKGYDGMVVLGGTQHANDDDKWPAFPAILESMRDFHREGRGLLGICLGSQLMARAFGGKVRRHTHLEVGFHDLTVTPEGQKDPVLGGLGASARIMQWHEDTFDLPAEAALLMAGEGCRNQAFRLGKRAYAFQCHFEATPAIAETWFEACEPGLGKHIGPENVPATVKRLRAEWPVDAPAARRFAETITDRWLTLG